MTQGTPGVFLFPHTTLSERDFRHLDLLLPGFSLLQVVRPPAVPGWARTASLPTIRDEAQIERIDLYLRGYREFARVHGEGSLLAGLNRFWPDANLESRFGIQHDLKGKPPLELTDRDRLILEAAVFLEMARDLDEKEMEMESDYSEASGLEEQFREILGITEDRDIEDLDAPIDLLSPPLVPDRTYLSFMLSKRTAFWLRLFFLNPIEVQPVFLAIVPEAADLLLDPFRIEGYRTGSPLHPLQKELGHIPSTAGLTHTEFQALTAHLDTAGTRKSWWDSLNALLLAPEDASLMKHSGESLKALAADIESFLGNAGHGSAETLDLNLVHSDRWSGDDLWGGVDKNGRETLADNRPAAARLRPLLLFIG